MITVRYGTFETNSSSCHSITVFKNAADWENFKNKKTYIRRCMYEMEEHTEQFNVITSENKDDYIRSIDDLYHTVEDCIKNDSGPLRSHSYYSYNSGLAELEHETYNYLQKNFNKDLFNRILFSAGNEEVCKLNKPIDVCYDYSGSGHIYTYDKLTINDLFDYIFSGKRFDDIPSFYTSDMCDWNNAKVEEYVNKSTGEEMVVVTRDEEC